MQFHSIIKISDNIFPLLYMVKCCLISGSRCYFRQIKSINQEF